MTDRNLALVSLAISTLAVVGALVSRRPEGGARPSALELELLESDVDRLAALLDELSAELAESSQVDDADPPAEAGGSGDGRAVPADSQSELDWMRDLEARLALVEEAVAAGAHSSVAPDRQREEAQLLALEKSALARSALDSYVAQVLDPQRSSEERLGALRMIQMLPRSLLTEDPRLAAGAAEFIRECPEDEIVEDAVEVMGRMALPEMLDTYVELLHGEGPDRVRFEAVDALERLRDEPRAVAALRYAAGNSDSPAVRDRAARALDE